MIGVVSVVGVVLRLVLALPLCRCGVSVVVVVGGVLLVLVLAL